MRPKTASAAVLLFTGVISAQETSTEQLMDMNLGDLLNLQVTVTSGGKGTGLAQAPGIVTVYTREQLRSVGARDLFDALMLVPGLDFGVDVWSLVGLGVRGNWASEGKALLLVDGIEMNERLYGTLQFVNHYLVDDIERIEVIRGPGSALYGGCAELAVINVITRAVGEANRVGARAGVQMMDQEFGGAAGGLTMGLKAGAADISLAGGYSFARRSTRDYVNLHGDSFSLLENGDMQLVHANLGVRWKGLDVRVIADRYTQEEQDGYEFVYSEPALATYDTYVLKAGYQAKLRVRATLTPWVSVMWQRPWNENLIDDTTGNQSPYTKWTLTGRGGLSLAWDPSEHLNVLAGIEASGDYAKSLIDMDYGDDEYFAFYDGSYTYTQASGAAYLQGLLSWRWLNATIGGRLEYNPDFGWAFAPRGRSTGCSADSTSNSLAVVPTSRRQSRMSTPTETRPQSWEHPKSSRSRPGPPSLRQGLRLPAP